MAATNSNSMNVPHQISQNSYRLPYLDGLRAISIIMVILCHLVAHYHPSSILPNALVAIFANGSLGVTIFFVISGFIITTLLLNELSISSTLSLKRFYLKRAFRILPPFYFYLLVVWLLHLGIGLSIDSTGIWTAATFTQRYLPYDVPWWTGHSWSLSVEEIFYVIWPFILLSFGKNKAGRFALLWVIFAPFIRVASYFFVNDEIRDNIETLFQVRADSIFFGALVAIYFDDVKSNSIANSFFRRKLQIICMCLAIFVSPLLAFFYHRYYQMTLGYSLEPASVAIFMWWLLKERPRSIGRILNSRLMIHIGLISYSLYIWQQLFLSPGKEFWFHLFPFNILLTFLTAEMSHRIIEKRIKYR